MNLALLWKVHDNLAPKSLSDSPMLDGMPSTKPTTSKVFMPSLKPSLKEQSHKPSVMAVPQSAKPTPQPFVKETKEPTTKPNFKTAKPSPPPVMKESKKPTVYKVSNAPSARPEKETMKPTATKSAMPSKPETKTTTKPSTTPIAKTSVAPSTAKPIKESRALMTTTDVFTSQLYSGGNM